MDDALKKKLAAAAAAGAVAVAAQLSGWFEGDKPTPYKDPVGVLTVCDGHTGPDIDPKHVYTPQECAALHQRDIEVSRAEMRKYITAPLTLGQEGALIDFTFNLGARNLTVPTQPTGKTIAYLFNSGRAEDGCNAMTRFASAGGVVLKGLVVRRGAEQELCLKGPQ